MSTDAGTDAGTDVSTEPTPAHPLSLETLELTAPGTSCHLDGTCD